MNKYQLTEYAELLFSTAVYKTANITDAEDLVQDTLIAALAAIEQKKEIIDPKGWLMTVLNRRYYDMLRRKYRKPLVSFDVIEDIPENNAVWDKIESSEAAENIRRSLSSLVSLYRQVMVRYYMHNESIRQIADALGIPENTVKSRLDTGRKHIRKEFDMENYTKQSYEPEQLWLCNSGKSGLNNEPFSLVENNRIEMNLLILAYEKPVTVPELAKAIGISTTYIEPIVDKLVTGELMKRVSDKVYTDFIIYTEKDRTANNRLEREIADKCYKGVWEIVDSGFYELRQADFYCKLPSSQQEKLESFFAVRTVQAAVNNVRNQVSGTYPFESYPDRKNGGKWFAMGNRYPSSYDWKKEYHKYSISGESVQQLDNYCGAKAIASCEYDCDLGKTHSGYGGDGDLPFRMDGIDVVKMLYALHKGKEDDLPIINTHCFENTEGLIRMGFLERDKNDRVINAIPVIGMADRWKLYKLSEKYDNIISDSFEKEFMRLMNDPVKLPEHLRSVPEWQRYMWCCSSLTMMIILNAHHSGLFFGERDLESSPVPAKFIAVDI